MVAYETFQKIRNKYGYCASWALWADEGETLKSNVGDLTILDPDENADLLAQLKPEFILVGLNISRTLGVEPLANFHDSKPYATDYKIRYALKGTIFWGAYMTDIIKDFDEVSSVTMMEYLKENPDVERVNADLFRKEFMDIGVVEPTLIAFGGDVFSILKRNFSDEFEVKKIPHYAAYISKENYRRHVLSLQAEFGFR